MSQTKKHLSDPLLVRLISGSASEQDRLHCAEHLSTCDRCLAHYTKLLTDDLCLEPQSPAAPQVLRQLHRQAIRQLARRAAVAAAAIILAMVLWMTDVFTNIVPKAEAPTLSAPMQEQRVSLSDTLGSFFYRLSGSLTELTLTYPDPKADADGADSFNKES